MMENEVRDEVIKIYIIYFLHLLLDFPPAFFIYKGSFFCSFGLQGVKNPPFLVIQCGLVDIRCVATDLKDFFRLAYFPSWILVDCKCYLHFEGLLKAKIHLSTKITKGRGKRKNEVKIRFKGLQKELGKN